MKPIRLFLYSALLLTLAGCATEQATTKPISKPTPEKQTAKPTAERPHDKAEHQDATPVCKKPSTHCSNTVTAEFSNKGVLWIAWVNDGHIYVQSSKDQGQTFSKPVMVNATGEKIAAKGENRPKIKLDNKGNVYVTWAWSLGKRHSGHIRFSRSTNGGKTFSAPATINDNIEPIGHSFDSMAIGRHGEIFIAWLDARDTEAAKKAGTEFNGSSLYYTWSNNGGKTFHANKRIAAHVCQCCRLQTAIAKDNTPVVFWRHIFDDNIRDHALVKFTDWQTPGDVQRVSHENWKIDACPHHGGGLAISETDVYHAVWFSNSDSKKGLFYAQSNDNGQHFSEPMPFGGQGAAHPHVQILGQQVAIVWQEFDGTNNRVQLLKSNDSGKTWSQVETVLQTTDAIDSPFLLSDGKNLYLSAQVTQQDYRLQKINF